MPGQNPPEIFLKLGERFARAKPSNLQLLLLLDVKNHSLFPVDDNSVNYGLVAASGGKVLFCIKAGEMSFVPGTVWDASVWKVRPVCPFAVAVVLWENDAARLRDPWPVDAHRRVLEWARVHLAHGVDGVEINEVLLPVGPALSVASHLRLAVVPFLGAPGGDVGLLLDSAAHVISRWDCELWVYGLVPAELEAACGRMIMASASSKKLVLAFMDVLWAMWDRVDVGLRAQVVVVRRWNHRGGAVARVLSCLGLSPADVWR